MILRVNTRGNGAQLGSYLVTLRENDHIEILEVDGRVDADEAYLKQVIMSMEFNAELTKTDKAFFNAQINPAYGEDNMSYEDVCRAADILALNTGYENQRRVIVRHNKKGRNHFHVVWERYNHDTGKMIDNKHSVLKADAARPQIEEALGHKKTPKRNPHRPELKEALTAIWNRTDTGNEFVKAARKAGYIIAAGTGNRPYMVVDENGRSSNLVRQIEGANTNDVRNRLRHEELMTDKRAIEVMRELQNDTSGKRERQKIELNPTSKKTVSDFAANRFDATKEDDTAIQKRKAEQLYNNFKAGTEEIAATIQPEQSDQQRKEEIAAAFADNDLSGKPLLSDKEIQLQKIIAEQERIKQRNKQRKPRR